MTKNTKSNESEITIMQMNQGILKCCIIGTSPLIYNAMSEKARHELLMPAPKKNAAERAANLKHSPFDEYRNSTYQARGNEGRTRLNFPSSAFKKALAGAALDIPGAQKSQIGRLVWAVGDRVEIFGTPQIFCAITRSADMNKTPDVRTRAILPEWACTLSLRFMTPILKEQTVVNLLAAAGFTQGIGDWRQQKGSGSYGQFQLVSADDENFNRICTTQGLVEQDAALANPEAYDDETEKLLTWFTEERKRREGSSAVSGTNGTAKKSRKTEIPAEA